MTPPREARGVVTLMSRRWWPAVAVCGFVLAVIAMAMELASGTIEPPPALVSTTTRIVTEQNTVARGVAQLPIDAEPAEAKATGYVGNTSTHKFHRASCHYAGCPNCVAKFATREEAIAAGFRPCGTCDP